MSGFFLIGSVMSSAAGSDRCRRREHLAHVRDADARRGGRLCVVALRSIGFSTRSGCAGWRSPCRRSVRRGADSPGSAVTQGRVTCERRQGPQGEVGGADRGTARVPRRSSRPPGQLREICAALDMPRSSAHALLRTLVAQGWVRSDASGTLYGVGIRALLVGTSYLDSDPYLPLITPFLDELRRTSTRRFIWGASTAPTSCTWPPASPSSTSAHPNRVAGGCPPTPPRWARRCWPSASAPTGTSTSRPRSKPLTPHTITDRGVLDEALDEVRVRGYATDDEENTLGVAVFRRRRCVTASPRRTPSAPRCRWRG